MKVVLSPQAEESLPVQYVGGLSSYASFSRIIMAMERAGELELSPNEYIGAVQIEEHGLTFVINSK